MPVTRGVLVAAATLATAAAWLAFAHASVATPHHHGASASTFLAVTAMWLAMVVAMMTPTVLPWIAAYAKLVATPDGPPAGRAISAFTAGYGVVWLGYSGLAAALQMALAGVGLLLGDRLSATLGGVVLVAAGAFQFMPLKGACLAHCRSPLSYFMAHWQDGPIGGFRLGLTHGAFCLGCCWLMMLTGLAMGVMNLAWMAVLTVVVALEQMAPGGVWLGRGFGMLLIAWGVWLVS